jgi:AraC-like DNA-binding protein
MILLSVDIATMLLFALFGLRVLILFPRRRESWVIVFLCVAVMAHVVLSRVEYGPWIPEAYRMHVGEGTLVLNVIRNLTPGLFALLTYLLFTDREKQPRWLYALLFVQFVLELLRGMNFNAIDANLLSAWLQLVFAGLAIYWTIAYWRADLVAMRRRARAVVSIILSVNTVASTILLRLVIPENSYANYQGYVVLSVFTMLLGLFLLLRLMDGAVGVPIPERAKKSVASLEETRKGEDELAVKRLDILLREQCVYKETGLTLKALADRVGVPEYRLRQVIHEQLGHRNFNSFVHSHRIRDAAQQLADQNLRRTSILTIAQSVGYESINTFNRAFREVMGVTPSEYRKQSGQLQDASS